MLHYFFKKITCAYTYLLWFVNDDVFLSRSTLHVDQVALIIDYIS